MFKLHNKSTAPVKSQILIDQSVKTYGFLPNLHAILAEAPITYKAYLDTFSLFEKESSFTPLEQQIVFQTANYENNCNYCMPGHSMLMTMMKMPKDIIDALREGTPIEDKKLEILRQFSSSLLANKGHVSKSEIQAFLNQGYTQKQALEILVGLSSKLISNFTNSMAETPIDEPVKAFAWTHPKLRASKVTEQI